MNKKNMLKKVLVVYFSFDVLLHKCIFKLSIGSCKHI